MKVFYSPDFVGAAHGFDTTRKAGWVADSLTSNPYSGLTLTEPTPLAESDLLRVHSEDYVDAVRTGKPAQLAETQGFSWDPALWHMVLASNGGVVAAAHAALTGGVSGSLSSGLHHAKREHGSGFCTFNGLVIAAKKLLDEGAAQSVMILDLDAHCGGGTAELVNNDERIEHVDVSVSAFDRYTDTDNSRLRIVHDADDYLTTVRDMLNAAGQHSLCLYNAGMDPHEDCAIGGLNGITNDILAQREKLVFDWCRAHETPVAFVLAGGYIGSRLDQADLVAAHRLTIAEATRSHL
ncbi:hypothetical protein IEU95_16045 [Hoyosella rhizosphaerae]|uniref:Histone deacetylase n=1 Tax=Hoyosella rhizosphaerae TaxID=1755582 RepID=A0A916UIK1_9ACTN|nr:hypothetical protein [Hoyosella rhizosphaerae]MBN4928346.1 hypothetical protein [Hoyosella rhizosphaerae]GGC74257.1 histone deacetylase [Hoyosella rhizosphaerae]